MMDGAENQRAKDINVEFLARMEAEAKVRECWPPTPAPLWLAEGWLGHRGGRAPAGQRGWGVQGCWGGCLPSRWQPAASRGGPAQRRAGRL